MNSVFTILLKNQNTDLIEVNMISTVEKWGNINKAVNGDRVK